MHAVGVECPFTLRTSGKGVNQQFGYATRVNLEVKISGDRIFPQLDKGRSASYDQIYDKQTHNRKRLDLRLFPGRKVSVGQL